MRIGTAMRMSTGAPLGTSATGPSMYGRKTKLQEGEFTQVVYNLIADQRYDEARQILNVQLEYFPQSRAALSLLAYCSYMMQDWQNAVKQ